MSESLKVACLQFDICWEDPSANYAIIEHHLKHIKEHIDLLLLPEMFTTGFSMTPKLLAETMDGPSIEKMKSWAKQIRGAVAGSLIIEEGEHYYNRFVLVKENGQTEHYDKRHLFGLAGEGDEYTAGNKQVIWNLNGWKLCPLICYDLRFPVWSRNTVAYDALLYVASWPSPRHLAWEKLLQARAIENQTFVLGCNRCGVDGNNYNYNGGSMIIDYVGDVLQKGGHENQVIIQTLSKTKMQVFREKLPFLKDRDRFEISI